MANSCVTVELSRVEVKKCHPNMMYSLRLSEEQGACR